MLEKIKELALFLAVDPLTADQVIEHLGKVVQDFGGNVTIQPRDPFFKTAGLVRELDMTTLKTTNRPAAVILTPTDPLTLKSLTVAFGPYQQIPAEERVPPQVIFYLDLPGRPYTVALIGEVKGNRVVRLSLRRDIRL
jgi:hypothetical protein